MTDPYLEAKRAAGRAAADLVETGTKIGLGTGSTFVHVLQRLRERMDEEGLEVCGVPTSEGTANKARELGIPMTTLDEVEGLDLAIDGADEVDEQRTLIKGGGGALVREKIVAAAAAEMVVIVSGNKMVDRVGTTFRLPVEVLAFGWRTVARAIDALNGAPELRTNDGEPFVTDNGNYILDCNFGPIADPATLERQLNMLPGVLDNGLFVGMAGRVLVGESDGTVRLLD